MPIAVALAAARSSLPSALKSPLIMTPGLLPATTGRANVPSPFPKRNQQRTRSALRRLCDDQIAFAVAVEVTENNVPRVWHTAATRREDGRSKTSVAGTQFGNYVPRCKGR